MLKNIKRVLAIVILSSIAMWTYAEEAAPVYDADNFPPQFDGQMDSGLADASSAAIAQEAPAVQNTQNVYTQPSTQSMSMDQRMARMEQQMLNLQRKDLANKIDILQNDIQTLRGQVEDLSHQTQLVQKSGAKPEAAKNEIQGLRTQIEQLTQKVQQLQSSDTAMHTAEADSKSNATTKSKAKPVLLAEASVDAKNKKKIAETTQPNVAEEQQIYQTAYDLIKGKKYNEAITVLQKMLQKYPSGQFAANAHYWLGELYGLVGKNDQSAVEFDKVVTQFSNSPKVADSQLKLGLIYAAQFKWTDARGAFKKVINHYPGTASARLASEQLKQLKEAGH